MGALPISRSVYKGGWGAWELALRYSDLNLNGGEVQGGKLKIASVGLNWWLSPFFKIDVNYRHMWLDQMGAQENSDGILSRILLILE